MAKLHFNYATMNSGKSNSLMQTAYNYEEQKYKVLVLKPGTDTKGKETIVSRIGLSRKVDFIINENENILNLLKGNLDEIKCIFVDEAQFLKRDQIDELYILCKAYDISVICYGLRTNFKMESFEGSARLLAIADVLNEGITICECGHMARHVGRKVNGKFVSDGPEIVIDGEANVDYVPLCGKCYLEKVQKIDFNEIRNKGFMKKKKK